MQEKVELQVRARFGKRDGASDYSWLFGRENVPPELLSVCEPLARTSASAGTYISLIAKAGTESYLVRAFRQGVDNAYRTIAALEVAVIIAPQQLPIGHWLGLAVVSIQKHERERIGESSQFTINVPPPTIEPAEPERDQLARARLGLPLSATFRVALSLLNVRPWLYRGVCFASSGKQDLPLPWINELAPYLCVNFSDPRLSDMESALMDAALSRQISQAEWEALRVLRPEQIREAIQWSLNPATESPVKSSEDELLPWLVAFRASSATGASLLKTLRRDVKPHAVSASVATFVMKDVSVEAASFILALMRGEALRPELSVIEELAAQGYLEDEETAPLSAWVEYARLSTAVAEQAVRRFVERGVELPAAQFVLDLEATDSSRPIRLDSLKVAAQLAVNYGLQAPRRRLLEAVQSVTWPEQLRLLGELGSTYCGWAQALMQLISNGTVPQADTLTPEEIKVAIEVRARVLNIPTALLEVLAILVRAERLEEATQLLRALEGTQATGIDAATYKVLRARLGLGPPASPPPQATVLRLLAQFDLARPSDISLGEADEPKLVEYARIWPATSMLANIIQGCDDDLPVDPAPEFPSTWTEAVRQALNTSRAARWLQKLDTPERRSALRWLAELHGFEAETLEALCGEDALPAAPLEEDILPWVSAYTSSFTRAQCLRSLSNAVAAGVSRGNDHLAEKFVRALFSQIDETNCAFASYALSRVGPFPVLTGVEPEMIVAVAPWLDALALIDGIFVNTETTLSKRPDVVSQLVKQLREKGIGCPAHGYTREQRQRHLTFAAALSDVPGWEALAPTSSTRMKYAKGLLAQLGLDLQTSQIILPAETSDEPPDSVTLAGEEL
jgi:hypothetical protein